MSSAEKFTQSTKRQYKPVEHLNKFRILIFNNDYVDAIVLN